MNNLFFRVVSVRHLLVATAALLLFGFRPTAIAGVETPIQGTPVFIGNRLSDFRLAGQGTAAEFRSTVVTGQSFDWGIRVQVTARTARPYDVQLLTPPTTVALKKGEFILAILNVRCLVAPDGIGVFSSHIQASEAPWTSLGATDMAVGKEWKQVFIVGQAPQDFAAGKYELTLHLGYQSQTLEFGGIALLNLGLDADVTKLPITHLTYPGQEPDAAWRTAAAERIEKYRKSDLTVRVVNRNGQPVKGANVHLQMQRHAYGFGTFLECPVMIGSGPDTDKLRAWTLKLFNRCTTPIYWADWGWANPNARQDFLACAKWAADNQLATRGHCIIYPGWQFLPAAIRPLEQNPPALRKRLLEQVAEVTDATRPFQFTEYDVCNELRDLTDIHRLLGRDAVAEWFAVARAHAPNSRLAINENTILTRCGITKPEQDNYADWIQYLIDHDQAPDVIGMQGHFGEAVTGPETVLHILDRFAKFGKAIQVTEFDLITRDEQGQTRYTRDFLTAVFSHPATDAFTMWGFWEGKMWQPLGAMIRKDWTLKPNGEAWLKLVFKEWWTDVSTATSRDGSCTTRGFLGDYRITATSGGQEKSTLVKLTKQTRPIVIVLE